MTTPESHLPVPCHGYITERIAEIRKIHTPEGIETVEPVEIGGTRQWISIRGLNQNNPVLLFMHGGPASPMMPLSWAYQKPWEDFFTVVNWDQRGAGKNALESDMKELAPTLTLERFTQDAEEMVNYLCKRMGKEKIFVLGYSWGSFLGIHLAKHIPERLYAYISLGQMGLDWVDKSFTRLMHLVNQSGNQEAITELESIMPFPDLGEAWPKKKYRTFLKWARIFNGGWYGKPDLELFFSLQEWAPEYSEADLEIFLKRTEELTKIMIPLLDDINFETIGFEFQIPIFIFQGRNDLHTSYSAAKVYFEHIQSPLKKFITFERSAHFPMFEEPGRFLMTLVNEVLPMAGESVYFKPVDDSAE